MKKVLNRIYAKFHKLHLFILRAHSAYSGRACREVNSSQLHSNNKYNLPESCKSYLLLLLLLLLVSLVVLGSPKEAKAAAASFHLSPSSEQVKVGDTFSASVMISADSAINAGEGSVSFPADILEYQSVSTAGSIFTLWISGPSGNATSVTFGGGLASPGYSGSDGKVLTITWKAKANGTAAININGSKILANNGAGTNILSGNSGGTVIVEAVTAVSQATNVSSSTHPDQNAWYNQEKVGLAWSASSAQGYSFALDQSASTIPSASIVSTKSKSYDIAIEGIWYFHVRAKFDSDWGPITHFKIQIDTVPPGEFTVSINQESGTTNPTPIVTFEAKDATSGIDHYEAVVDGETSISISSGDKLPKQHPGNHTVTIKAYDKAGNVRESQASYKIEGIPAPYVAVCSKIVGLLQPVSIEGVADEGDTIVIYLNGKEIDKFLAEDKKIADSEQAICSDNTIFASAGDNVKIIWRYVYQQLLYPGEHSFQLMRINKDGAESELTQALKVRVESSTVTAFGYIFPTKYIIGILILIIFILSTIIVYTLYKLRHLAKKGGMAIGLAYGKVRQLFSKTEKKIDREIDKIIPEYDVSEGTIKEVKKDLKNKIHQDIQEEEQMIEPPSHNQPEKQDQRENLEESKHE